MTTPAQALTALKAQLIASTHLDYVDDVLLQAREQITRFPQIALEPVTIDENDETDSHVELFMTINLVACIKAQNAEKQIIGDTRERGILDIENDIKKAIYSDTTLGQTCVDVTTPKTSYLKGEHPAMILIMTVVLRFRQTATERT